MSQVLSATLLLVLFSFFFLFARSAPTIVCHPPHATPVQVGLIYYNMVGTLCVPTGASTALILVPGATYNRIYWNFTLPGNDFYNFRKAMNNAGIATYVVDRLGTGISSRPLSLTVTATLQATAVRNVVMELRAGQMNGFLPNKVVLGGHSLGSMLNHIEVSTYNDVDGLLVSGLTHGLPVLGASSIFSNSYPCPLDPITSPSGCDAGYFTTLPGTRSIFYFPATTDPAVLAMDEATKDVYSVTESPDGVGVGVVSPVTNNIRVPVLLAVGSQDSLFCGLGGTSDCSSDAAVRTGELPYFMNSPNFQTYVLPLSGHDMNLANNTNLFQQRVVTWVNSL